MAQIVSTENLGGFAPRGVEHQLGVHINQRHTDYLEDLGLGYSAIKALYLSPTEYWHESPYNPRREAPKENPAFNRGEALHVAVLESMRLYEKVYGVAPTVERFPNHLTLVRDLLAACEKYHLDTRYTTKGELIARLIRANAPVEILAVEEERFRMSGKKPISEEADEQIRLLHRMIMRSPQEMNLPEGGETLAHLLEKSLNEVSIFWVDDQGIRQRARFDILKPNVTGDLKSITQWKRANFKTDLLREVILRGYMIQVVHYHEARRQLRIAVAEGRVFGGNKTQRKLLDRIARAEEWAWVFVFAKMAGAPQVRGIVINNGDPQVEKAMQQRDEALSNFIYYRDFHGGLDVPWFDPDVIWVPDHTDWPSFSVLGEH